MPEMLLIIYPNPLPFRLNNLASFELSAEKSRKNIRRQVTRADVHPSIFIYLAAKKTAAVSPLFPKDLGTLDVLRVVKQQGPAFPASEIFGLVKALRS